MLSKAAKNELVREYNDVFKANPSVMVVEYKGLTVRDLELLRANLKKADTQLKIVKNTLLRKAAKDTQIERINELFDGPTAVAICRKDPTAAAKVFVDSVKKLPLLKIKGGIVEGSVIGENQISDLSRLPSRQELIAQFLGLLKSPVSNFLGTLTQLQSRVVYALSAVKDTKGKEDN
ncbi:MAG TPA: 50S ribosomal protein L10 [Thermodesulfobacteriota bacterium]|nr:50S ribosomal protein L10 [Thermodesulfobacteriota bacterium]